MSTEKLITLLRKRIENIGNKCYSPDLPQDNENCVSIRFGQGENVKSLTNDILYSTIPCYLLIRGTTNDTLTRQISDNIFNSLDGIKNIDNDDIHIISIHCKTPNYAFRDEKQRIHYNINCKCEIEWRNV